jgi:hypothetical protein
VKCGCVNLPRRHELWGSDDRSSATHRHLDACRRAHSDDRGAWCDRSFCDVGTGSGIGAGTGTGTCTCTGPGLAQSNQVHTLFVQQATRDGVGGHPVADDGDVTPRHAEWHGGVVPSPLAQGPHT